MMLFRKPAMSALNMLVLTCVLTTTAAHRILGLFPHPGLSHFKVFHPIMRALADAGHEVTVVSYFPDEQPYPNYRDLRFEGQPILTNTFSLEGFAGRRFVNNFIEFSELAAWGASSCAAALKSPAIDDVLRIHRGTPFDLVVTEFFATDCLLGVSWLMKVPFVGLSSCALMPWHYDRIGLPDTPSYIPSEFSAFSESMSMWERFENWLVTRAVKLLYRTVQWEDNRLLQEKFGPGIPDVQDIARNTSLLLVNQHYSLSGARPLVPMVVEIGGVHIQQAKPLPSDIGAFLDLAHEGVIVISFGSVLKAATLPVEKRRAMVDALRRIQRSVLWKWEEDMEDKPDNVFISKWLPQRDVLCHPNVRLFISHGGLLGVSEAVHCGVPVVTIPIYGDQFLNAAALANRGMGITVDYGAIEANYLYQCLQRALSPRMLDKAKKISKAYRSRPQTAAQLAVWSIENVIENGASRLEQSFGSNLSWPLYYSLDSIALLMLLTTAMVVTVLGMLRALLFRNRAGGRYARDNVGNRKKKRN